MVLCQCDLTNAIKKPNLTGWVEASVARRGLEPLISRMKTWRPNRLDERAKISRVQK